MRLLSLKVSSAAILCCCLVQGQLLVDGDGDMTVKLKLDELSRKYEGLNQNLGDKFDSLTRTVEALKASLTSLVTENSCKDALKDLRQKMETDECMIGTHNCSRNADCKNTVIGFECNCRSGYSGDGYTCSDVDECAVFETPCNANANCVNTEGNYECQCQEGFEEAGYSCVDIDECESDHGCEPPLSCSNTQGSFECLCLAPYKLDGDSCELDCSDPAIHVEGLGCVTPLLELQTWLDARDSCKKLGLKLLEDLKPEHFDTIAEHFMPHMMQRPFPWIGLRYKVWLTSKHRVANEVIAEDEDFLEGGCGNFDLRDIKRGVWDTNCFDEEYALCQSIA